MATNLPPPTGDAGNPPTNLTVWGKLFNWLYLLWKSVTNLTFGADTSTYSAAVFATIGQADTGSVGLLMGQKVVVSAHNTSGQSIANASTTIMTGWTNVFDNSGGAWNASTGTFTCNNPGVYFFSAKFRLANASTGTTFEVTTVLRKNGSDSSNAEIYDAGGTNAGPSGTPLGVFVLAQGDTLQAGAFQSSGSAQNLNTTSQFSQLTIFQLL